MWLSVLLFERSCFRLNSRFSSSIQFFYTSDKVKIARWVRSSSFVQKRTLSFSFCFLECLGKVLNKGVTHHVWQQLIGPQCMIHSVELSYARKEHIPSCVLLWQKCALIKVKGFGTLSNATSGRSRSRWRIRIVLKWLPLQRKKNSSALQSAVVLWQKKPRIVEDSFTGTMCLRRFLRLHFVPFERDRLAATHAAATAQRELCSICTCSAHITSRARLTGHASGSFLFHCPERRG